MHPWQWLMPIRMSSKTYTVVTQSSSVTFQIPFCGLVHQASRSDRHHPSHWALPKDSASAQGPPSVRLCQHSHDVLPSTDKSHIPRLESFNRTRRLLDFHDWASGPTKSIRTEGFLEVFKKPNGTMLFQRHREIKSQEASLM